MIRSDLIYNLSLLVSLSIISSFINFKIKKKINLLILEGLLFGITSIIGMMYPVIVAKGLIFDGRTIVISLASLFFGPIAGGIAAFLALVYRIYIGGIGIIMGVSTIIESYIIGTIYYLINKKKNLLPSNSQIYLMGLIIHFIMIFLMVTLPKEKIMEAYKTIAPTVIIFYPIITLFIGRILLDQIQRREYFQRLTNSEYFLELFSTVLVKL